MAEAAQKHKQVKNRMVIFQPVYVVENCTYCIGQSAGEQPPDSC